MPEKMKIINEIERQKSKDRKKHRCGASYSKNVRAKWPCCAINM